MIQIALSTLDQVCEHLIDDRRHGQRHAVFACGLQNNIQILPVKPGFETWLEIMLNHGWAAEFHHAILCQASA